MAPKYIIVIENCKDCDYSHTKICYHIHNFNKPIDTSKGIPPTCPRPGLTEVKVESNPWNECERRSNDDQAHV
jgi:hypothetical protein